ncbi:HNH endonuclease signature motif containing protein [Streptomyces sp. NPDC048200]|uniref:HNH endonuclease signature motif containing protein n=1 Tax=Streptomyces sp. NPDC048200 TaxID=3365512 RepID=UPI003720E073
MPARKATWQEREARFWSNVERTGPTPAHRPDLGPCWIWKLRKTKAGYGLLTWHGVGNEYAHRAAYQFTSGAIGEGLEIDHLCRNRACANPQHLEAVTHLENVRRAEPAQRTHCQRGHEYSPENTHRDPNKPGKRICKACRKEMSAEWRAANREQFNQRCRNYRRARKVAA